MDEVDRLFLNQTDSKHVLDLTCLKNEFESFINRANLIHLNEYDLMSIFTRLCFKVNERSAI